MLTLSKVFSLQKLAASQHLDVLALTETHLTEHNLDLVNEVTSKWRLIIIPSPLRRHSQQEKGGIALILKEHIYATPRDNNINDETEQIYSWTLSSDTCNENTCVTITYISPVVTSDTLQKIHNHIQNSRRMTGANIILGDFNSYLGNMKYEPHLNVAEQGIWGPISGDPSPSHTPSRVSSNQNANTREKWFKNLLTSSELVVLNGREHNIAPYKTFPYTHFQKLQESSTTLTSETIIDYALTNKRV